MKLKQFHYEIDYLHKVKKTYRGEHMTSLLIMFGYLLNIILLIAVYQLFKQLQDIKQNQKTDMNELLEHYVAEIKEENQKLQQMLQQNKNTKQNFKEQLNKEQERYVDEEKEEGFESVGHTNEMDEEDESEHVASNHNVLDLLGQNKDSFEQSFESKVLSLDNQGLSSNKIAQKLNCGKTEVELILKFQKH